MSPRIPYDYLRMFAVKSDEDFVALAAEIAFTPRPDPEGESMSNFRERVIYCLEQYSPYGA